MSTIEAWKQHARRLKPELYALYLAYHDPRVPWYARAFAALVVAYAFSPIDLIPDPIPVLGYLDDLILVPLGIALALRMLPDDVLDDCRTRAQQMMAEGKPRSRLGAAMILLVWLALAALVVRWLL